MILFIIITSLLFSFRTASRDLSAIHCSDNAVDQASSLSNLRLTYNITASPELRRYPRSSKDNFVKDENPLLCPPCEQMHCFPKRKRRLQCKGGTTLDICNCCRVCAKLEGELCGGQHNYLGKCDRGLQCEAQAPQILHLQRDGVKKVYTITKGVCKKSPDMLTSDEGYGSFCRPKCSSEFCKKNPKAICSAKDNMEKEQDCQGPCQHTSCKACRFVQPEPKCLKCAENDLKCLRCFGKCIQKSICQKKQYPCKGWTTSKVEKGKFQCQIPECVNS